MLIIAILLGCKSLTINKKNIRKLKSSFYKNEFIGIYIYDVKADKVIYNFNSNKYFTAAINVKIFTPLTFLSDFITTFKYVLNKNTITIQGTRYPSF